MPLSQNESGRAFEYGLAVSLSERIPADIEENPQIQTAKRKRIPARSTA